MRLKVNEEKSEVRQPDEVHFLGFRFRCRQTGEDRRDRRPPSAKAERRLEARCAEMTPPNWGRSLAACMNRLSRYLNGWVAHFGYARPKPSRIEAIDAHIRRRCERSSSANGSALASCSGI